MCNALSLMPNKKEKQSCAFICCNRAKEETRETLYHTVSILLRYLKLGVLSMKDVVHQGYIV